MNLRRFYFLTTSLILPAALFSQACPVNIGFDSTNYSNWNGYVATGSSSWNWMNYIPNWTAGIQTSGLNNPMQAFCMPCGTPQTQHHTLLNVPPGINNPPYNCPGWDSIAINWSTFQSDISFLCPANNNPSVRLGNADGTGATEKLEHTFTVVNGGTDLYISFALVFYRDAFGSEFPYEGSFFKFRLSDAANTTIDSVYIEGNHFGLIDTTLLPAPRLLAPNFDTSMMYTKYYVYRKWHTTHYDLSSYIGQNVKIEFRTGDCTLGGHYGYAYVDASCTEGNPKSVENHSLFSKTPLVFSPASDGNSIFFEGLGTNETVFELYDVNGKMVLEKNLAINNGMIDVSNLSAGIYIAHAYNKDFNLNQKIILAR